MSTSTAVEGHTRTPHPIGAMALVPFFILAFALPWLLLGSYMLQPERMGALFGELSGQHPFFILSTWAPAIAAITIVLYSCGPGGLKGFLGRLLMWRCPWRWVAFVIIGMPLIFAAGSWVKGNLFGQPWPFDSLGAVLAAMLFMLFLGPVEEIGWRGLMQPMLQRYMAPLWAGVLVGVVWAAWHLPAFLLSGTVQSGWSIMPFMLGTLCLSVIVTPLFNAAHGSILWPALFHFQAINPLWPDAQPYDTGFFLAAAVIVVWLNRETMFHRTGAATDVVPADHASR